MSATITFILEIFQRALLIVLILGTRGCTKFYLVQEESASKFCKKYFQHEDRATTTQLNNTRQKHEENPISFVPRVQDLTFDC